MNPSLRKKINFEGDFSDFAARNISECFQHFGWNLESWPVEKVSQEKLVNLKRKRGESGLTIDDDIEEYSDDEEDGNIEEDGNNEEDENFENVGSDETEEYIPVEDNLEPGEEENVDNEDRSENSNFDLNFTMSEEEVMEHINDSSTPPDEAVSQPQTDPLRLSQSQAQVPGPSSSHIPQSQSQVLVPGPGPSQDPLRLSQSQSSVGGPAISLSGPSQSSRRRLPEDVNQDRKAKRKNPREPEDHTPALTRKKSRQLGK